jgi:hypothetical protein
VSYAKAVELFEERKARIVAKLDRAREEQLRKIEDILGLTEKGLVEQLLDRKDK